MKVNVTIELDEDERVAVGLLETGKFVPASREQTRNYVSNVVMSSVGVATNIVVSQRKRIAEEIRDQLGITAIPDDE